jgi:hypothetical protein
VRRQRAVLVLLFTCIFTPLPGQAQSTTQTTAANFSTPDSPTPLAAEPQGMLCDAPPSPDRLHFDAEYVLWWLREGRVPPLVTTGSPASQGLLGQPDTRALYGDDRLETRHGDKFNGVRMGLGYWFDDEHSLGVEGNGFLLERDSTYFKAVSDGSVLLARPYFNALNGGPASDILAGPSAAGALSGGIVGYSRIELFGEEVNAVALLMQGSAGRVELLAGAHFLQMRDRVDLTSAGNLLANPSTLVGMADHLHANDQFYGGQVGLRGERDFGRWRLSLAGEVAPGATVTTLRVYGDQIHQTPLEKTIVPFGLAAQPSNTGLFSNTDFDIVSQLTVNVEYRLTQRLRAFAGYTFLLWANTIRAGDQIDLVVNPTLTSGAPQGPARPAVPFRSDTFWAQGVNMGVEFTW